MVQITVSTPPVQVTRGLQIYLEAIYQQKQYVASGEKSGSGSDWRASQNLMLTVSF